MTIITVIVFASTFILKGAIALNATLLSDEELNDKNDNDQNSEENSRKSSESEDKNTVKNLIWHISGKIKSDPITYF
jgi:hypothetical protein